MSAAPGEAASTGPAAALAALSAATIPTLDTPRQRLRAPQIKDFAAFAEIATTEGGLHIDEPMSRKEAWLDVGQLVAGWMLRGYGLWSVERRDDFSPRGQP